MREKDLTDDRSAAPSGASSLIPARIQSYPMKGKHPVYYYPDLNLLTLDGDNPSYIFAPQDFKETLFAFFLGLRKLVAIREVQHPPETLFVEPWKTCNLACTYCYAEGGPSPKKRLDAGRLSGVVNKYPFKHVLTFGGEPLVDREYLNDLYRSRRWDSFFFSTNGILLSRKSAQELIGLPNVRFQLSLEPSEWSYRVTVDGKKQLDLLAAHFPQMGTLPANLRLTIPPSAPYLPVKGVIDEFADLIGSMRFTISYWPAIGTTVAPWLSNWFDESYELIRNDTDGKYQGKLPGYDLSSYFLEMLWKGFRFYNCSAGYNSVAVSPDGELHGCHELAMENGTDLVSSCNDSLEIDEIKRLNLTYKWSDNIRNPTCVRCSAKYVCGGMCFATEPPRSACFFLLDALPLVLTQMVKYSARETMDLASRSEDRFKYLFSRREELAKRVRCDKWTRLVSGELRLGEAVELASRFLKN